MRDSGRRSVGVISALALSAYAMNTNHYVEQRAKARDVVDSVSEKSIAKMDAAQRKRNRKMRNRQRQFDRANGAVIA